MRQTKSTQAKAKPPRWVRTPRVTTRTITAAALLKRVKALVLEEPARLNMNSYVVALMGRYASEDKPRQPGQFYAAEPACGTIGCIAGWAAILLRGDRARPVQIGDHAAFVVGRAVGDARGHVAGLFVAGSLLGETLDFGQPGTEEHAQFVAARIDRYLAQRPELRRRVINVAAARKELATGRPSGRLCRERTGA